MNLVDEVKHKVLLGILILGFFLRIYHLRPWFHFEMDEEVIAWKTQQFWHDGTPFLIGGGTPFGVHLGPAFYYLSAIPLWISHGDPIVWGVLAAIAGTITIWLMWKVGKTLFDEKIGLIAAFFWAVSFPTVMFDRHWWPLVLDPLFSLLAAWSLFHILSGRKKWWIVLGLTLAIAWQADLTNLILFIASGTVALVVVKHQWKYIVTAAGIVIVSFAPLVVFEFRHPGANLGRLIIIRSDPAIAGSDLSKPILDLARFIPSTFASLLIPYARSDNLADWYTWCKDVARSRTLYSPIVMIVATGLLLYPLIRWIRKKKTADLSLVVVIGSGIGGISLFRILGGDLFDFYLAPLYPVFLIAMAMLIISHVKRKHLVLSIVFVLFLINLPSVLKAQHRQGLSTKRQAVAWVIEQVGERPFALESISRCHRYNGIRYLFMLAGREPSISFMDPNYSWLYTHPPETTYPDLFVAITTPQDLTMEQESRYNDVNEKAIARARFGDFEALIAPNNDHTLTINF